MEPIFSKEKVRSEGGHLRTQTLFYEYRYTPRGLTETPYNLREDDYKGTLSMYKIYMESESEYEAAQRLLGSWEHWQRLLKAPFFKKHIEKWREERAAREEAIARKTLVEEATNGNVTAAKALLTPTKSTGAGRPSKESVAAEAKRQIADGNKVQSILDRMSNV